MPCLPSKVGDQPQPSASPGPTRHQYQASAVSARRATQSQSPCSQVPPLPHKVKDHVTKCHACHAKMATRRSPARHQYQPNAVSNTPATESQSPCHPQTTPGRTSAPFGRLKCRAYHAKCTHRGPEPTQPQTCLLYTSDAADEEDSVDLGGRRIIKKKN